MAIMSQKWLRKIAIVTAGVAFAAGVALYLFQNHIIYLPIVPGMSRYPSSNPIGYRSPSDRQIPYEEATLETEDGVKLSSWLLYQNERKKVPTIVFFHENAGNIGYRLDFFEQLYKKLGVNVLAVSYRGYGDSEGSPSEAGIQKDAAAILEYAFTKAQIDNSQIILFGRSLGGAVAIYGLSSFPHYPVNPI
jgi:hypothetical protein